MHVTLFCAIDDKIGNRGNAEPHEGGNHGRSRSDEEMDWGIDRYWSDVVGAGDCRGAVGWRSAAVLRRRRRQHYHDGQPDGQQWARRVDRAGHHRLALLKALDGVTEPGAGFRPRLQSWR